MRDTNVINHTTGQNIAIRQARSKSKKYYTFEKTVTNPDGTSSVLDISSKIKNKFLSKFGLQKPKPITVVSYVEKLNKKIKGLRTLDVELSNYGIRVNNPTRESLKIGNGIEIPAKSTNFYKFDNGRLVGDNYFSQNNLDTNAVAEWTKNLQKAQKHNYFA